MTLRTTIVVLAIGLLRVPSLAADEVAANSGAFEVANVHFEQNATDGDVEAVVEIIGGDDGLTKLKLVTPDGRTVVNFAAPERSAVGMRQFRFESPEPKDAAALKKDFPAGVYVVTGTTSTGTSLQSQAVLSHKLPPTTSFVSPKADARNVSAHNLKVSWAPVKGVAGYTIELDPSKSSAHLELKLPASATSFVVPDGILAPGAKCQLGIGTISHDGNISVIETTFTTAGK
jgi:hypothetical protein